jgi:pyruvate-formate lyase
METGRDLAEGGARYHIFSPLLVGVSNAADSLHVIANLVFNRQLFTLAELTTCLATDWGARLLPVVGGEVPAFGPSVPRARIDEIRGLCLAEPRFGHGVEVVDRRGWWLLENFVECVREAREHPLHAAAFTRLEARYDRPGCPFTLHLAPGVGTFEQYVFSGSFNGASADGRRAGTSIASDLSPAPVPNDLPAAAEVDGRLIHARSSPLAASLQSYRHAVMQHLGDGAPVDYNLPEGFSEEALVAVLRRFANGEGGSICTFTVADPATFVAAQRDPDAHNLVRVRMGGWTEFFVTLFPDHQEQHKRRPLYV